VPANKTREACAGGAEQRAAARSEMLEADCPSIVEPRRRCHWPALRVVVAMVATVGGLVARQTSYSSSRAVDALLIRRVEAGKRTVSVNHCPEAVHNGEARLVGGSSSSRTVIAEHSLRPSP